jgi:ribonuclease BN (tRNA processing enzyme)
MKPAGREELDYTLITHIHPDHLGDLGPENPLSMKETTGSLALRMLTHGHRLQN